MVKIYGLNNVCDKWLFLMIILSWWKTKLEYAARSSAKMPAPYNLKGPAVLYQGSV